jgi:hypothetical protein
MLHSRPTAPCIHDTLKNITHYDFLPEKSRFEIEMSSGFSISSNYFPSANQTITNTGHFPLWVVKNGFSLALNCNYQFTKRWGSKCCVFDDINPHKDSNPESANGATYTYSSKAYFHNNRYLLGPELYLYSASKIRFGISALFGYALCVTPQFETIITGTPPTLISYFHYLLGKGFAYGSCLNLNYSPQKRYSINISALYSASEMTFPGIVLQTIPTGNSTIINPGPNTFIYPTKATVNLFQAAIGISWKIL